jgi:hypothetical protein
MFVEAFNYNFLTAIQRNKKMSAHFKKAALLANMISLLRFSNIWLKT